MKRTVFDLDSTLCVTDGTDYATAVPRLDRIARVRQHYNAGEFIIIDTARHAQWETLTVAQLMEWDVPYHELRVGEKVPADQYVDDRGINADQFFDDATQQAWPDDYFAQRTGNDPKRQAAFAQEFDFLRFHGIYGGSGTRTCDVGCSTGEFFEHLNWYGRRFGMEISPHARRLAEQSGIDFTRNILTEKDFFDVVIFRGTIQHLPHPFRYIEAAFKSLKSGGHIAFLATPNAGSLCYRLWQELPVSDDARNYWMPSARTLSTALRNFGFEIVAVEYPYLHGGYARPLRDAVSFARRLVGIGPTNFPFPGNMMNVLAVKR